MSNKELDFEVQSELKYVRTATNRVFDFLKQAPLTDSSRFDLRLSFEELLINGMRHGNKLDPEKKVKVRVLWTDTFIEFFIRDCGSGFSPGNLKDPTETHNVEAYHGRGVYLAKHLMDEVCYNDRGNEVIVKKYLGKNKGRGNESSDRG